MLSTEDYDVIGFVAHGDYTITSNGGWVATGNIKINNSYVNMNHVENEFKKLKKHIKWVSCLRDKQHQELGQIEVPKGRFKILNKPTGEKECLSIWFRTFNFFRYRAFNPGFDLQKQKPILIE